MRQVALIPLLALGACTQVQQPDDRICETPQGMQPGVWATCIHKWAYRLANAPGQNAEIAKAAVNACSEAITYQVNHAAPEERMALLAAINKSAPEEALFRVIQARAGHCAIPE